MWKTLKALYQAISAISLATWLWGLPWAGSAAVIGGVWATVSGLPAPVAGLIAFAFAVVGYVAYVGFILQRRDARPALSVSEEYEQAIRKAAAAGITSPDGSNRFFPPIIVQGSPPAKSNAAHDVTLADALGYVVNCEWGKPYHGSAFTTPLVAALTGTDIRKLLAIFTDLAEEGKLTIWGKETEFGVLKKIPATHWQDDQMTLADVVPFGRVERPYYDLRLSRQEIEKEWPHGQF